MIPLYGGAGPGKDSGPQQAPEDATAASPVASDEIVAPPDDEAVGAGAEAPETGADMAGEDAGQGPGDALGRDILLTAARDVRVLISYIARKKPEALPKVNSDTTIADMITAGHYTTEREKALWTQLGSLAETAKPASAESILEGKYYRVIYGKDGVGDQNRVVLNRVRAFAIIGFIFAFLLGAYVQVTSDGVKTLTADLEERAKIIEGDYAGTRVENLIRSAGAQGGKTPSGVTDGGDNTAARNQALADGTAAPTETGEDEPAPPPVVGAEMERLSGLSLAKRSLETEIRGGFSLLAVASWFSGPVVEVDGAGQPVVVEGADRNTYVVYNYAAVETQRSINSTLGDFMLPMIASFLGVAVFIIRDTSMRLESVSLSPMDDDAYLPRIILGLIAGLTIGWLTPSVAPMIVSMTNGAVSVTHAAAADGSSAPASLSKTALAFVVGYSVEVLFNVLDAIKKALGVVDDR
jgi:hypothetical protein